MQGVRLIRGPLTTGFTVVAYHLEIALEDTVKIKCSVKTYIYVICQLGGLYSEKL